MTSDVSGRLRGIAVRSAKRAAMITKAAAEILAPAGVDGDFGRTRGRRQVTVLSVEAWRDACDELGAALPWTTRRANLFVAGLPLQPLAGARLVIGNAVLEVTGETDPCKRMDEQHEGLRAALTPKARGGVTCRVVAGGKIAVGDEVKWEPAMEDLFAGSNERRVAGRRPPRAVG
ncbi:MAG: MOSC domain-containing protein [Rhodospirillaceae bacterium]